MDFTSKKTRQELVSLVQEISKGFQPEFERRLEEMLTPQEKMIQLYLKTLDFKGGDWFRPFHNVNVPAAMISICDREGCSRDLVYSALLHDAGNTLMKIAKTTEGADWTKVDKREKHMEIGGVMIYSILGILKSMGVISISDERILKLKEITETHDYPYIGKELTDPEARAHRCADRSWVVAGISYYKDFLAHNSDKVFVEKAAKMGFTLTPKDFLLNRLAWFYSNPSSLPEGWDQGSLPLLDRAKYNETVSGKCEPPYTKTGKTIVDSFFKRRASELEGFTQARNPQEFGDFFAKAVEEETAALINYAGKYHRAIA